MEQITTFKLKGMNKRKSYPGLEPSKGYTEKILTPVTLSGVVTPWSQVLAGGRSVDYKLVTNGGLEYFIVADSEWRGVLSMYCWEEVKVIGLLNVSNMTLIPQKVYPKGPTGEKEKVIDLAEWKSEEFVRKVKKMVKTVSDLVLVPAAVMAVMAL
jgi:hypothetical protein